MARLTDQSHKVLQHLASQYGATQQDLLDEAIETLRRKRFFEDANRAYAALHGDAEAHAALQHERTVLDGTLGDGVAP